MGQINSTNLPQYVSDTRAPATTKKLTGELPSTAQSQEISTPQDALQLTNLSGVLNGLKKGASAMRSQAIQVMSSVRGGTYQIDPMQVSKSIVGESLASH